MIRNPLFIALVKQPVRLKFLKNMKVMRTDIFMLFACATIIFACDSYDPLPEIEALLETKLPACYSQIEDPEKIDPEAIFVFEYQCQADCCLLLLEEVRKAGVQRAYCGTTPASDLTMAFCTRDKSALLRLNVINGDLHYEKFKIDPHE